MDTDQKLFQIAMDGPVAAGKGTVAKLVANKLGFLYVDTGATYRTAALHALRNNIDFSDVDRIVADMSAAKLEMHAPTAEEQDGRLVTVLLNGEDVSWQIRTPEVASAVSKVAVLAPLRKLMVQKQQEIASDQPVVMEGRDITYRVLPNADLKIFLSANNTVRAQRRHFQMQTRGETMSLEEVLADLIERDERDSSREADPLKVVDDAWVIDTSELSIEQVVELIVAKVMIMRSV